MKNVCVKKSEAGTWLSPADMIPAVDRKASPQAFAFGSGCGDCVPSRRCRCRSRWGLVCSWLSMRLRKTATALTASDNRALVGFLPSFQAPAFRYRVPNPTASHSLGTSPAARLRRAKGRLYGRPSAATGCRATDSSCCLSEICRQSLPDPGGSAWLEYTEAGS